MTILSLPRKGILCPRRVPATGPQGACSTIPSCLVTICSCESVAIPLPRRGVIRGDLGVFRGFPPRRIRWRETPEILATYDGGPSGIRTRVMVTITSSSLIANGCAVGSCEKPGVTKTRRGVLNAQAGVWGSSPARVLGWDANSEPLATPGDFGSPGKQLAKPVMWVRWDRDRPGLSRRRALADRAPG
jgi:hypothetical protein